MLCEKPMGLNLSECDRMIDACKVNKVKLGIAYYRNLFPVVRRIKGIMASDEIGRVVCVHINAFGYYNPEPGDRRYWFVKKDLAGGGPMFDFGCHRIEVLLNLLGPITCTKGLISKVAFEREVEDTATAMFRFESGTHAVLSVTHAAYEPQDTLDIFGTDGSLHVYDLNDGDIRIITRFSERTETYPCPLIVHQPLIEDFVMAVLEDHDPAVNAEIGREVNRIEDEIYKN